VRVFCSLERPFSHTQPWTIKARRLVSDPAINSMTLAQLIVRQTGQGHSRVALKVSSTSRHPPSCVLVTGSRADPDMIDADALAGAIDAGRQEPHGRHRTQLVHTPERWPRDTCSTAALWTDVLIPPPGQLGPAAAYLVLTRRKPFSPA